MAHQASCAECLAALRILHLCDVQALARMGVRSGGRPLRSKALLHKAAAPDPPTGALCVHWVVRHACAPGLAPEGDAGARAKSIKEGTCRV